MYKKLVTYINVAGKKSFFDKITDLWPMTYDLWPMTFILDLGADIPKFWRRTYIYQK